MKQKTLFLTLSFIILYAVNCKADNIKTINPKWVSVDSITDLQLLVLKGFKITKSINVQKNGYISEFEKLEDTIEKKDCTDNVDSLNKYVWSLIVKDLFKNPSNPQNNKQDDNYCNELSSKKGKGDQICIDELPMYRIDELNMNYDEFINTQRYVIKIKFGNHRVYYSDVDYGIVSYLTRCCIYNSNSEVLTIKQIEYRKISENIDLIQDSLLNQK